MPKRPTEEQMERAVAAGDPPVSAKHPADEEWLAAQQNWLASRRTASRALRKRKNLVGDRSKIALLGETTLLQSKDKVINGITQAKRYHTSRTVTHAPTH